MESIEDVITATSNIKVLSSLPIGMCMVDSDCRYKEVNAAWADMLGYASNDLIGVSVTQVTYPADRSIDSELSGALFNGEISSFTIKKRWVRKDGSIVRGTMTAFAHSDPAFKNCGIAMIVPDHNQAIDQSQTQEVVHDLHGLLHSAQLAAHALKSDPGNRSFLDSILKATELASALTKKLLTDNRPDPLATCNSHHVLRNCIAVASPTMPATISLSCRCKGRPEVAIDEASLSAVVINLLHNARDAINGSGNIEVICEQHDDCICIQVIDDGIGMNTNELAGATERHYTTKDKAGTGLGLYIADETLRSFGGSLELSSSLGTGTNVICQLPLAMQAS